MDAWMNLHSTDRSLPVQWAGRPSQEAPPAPLAAPTHHSRDAWACCAPPSSVLAGIALSTDVSALLSHGESFRSFPDASVLGQRWQDLRALVEPFEVWRGRRECCPHSLGLDSCQVLVTIDSCFSDHLWLYLILSLNHPSNKPPINIISALSLRCHLW